MTWSLGLQYAVNDAITIDLQGYGADETDNLTGNPAYARTDTYDKYDIGITYDDEDSLTELSFGVRILLINTKLQTELVVSLYV